MGCPFHVKQVSFSYQRNHPVLQDISFDLELGKIYGLFGKNGEGKTSLLKLMSGLLFPQSGNIFSAEENIFKRRVSSLQDVFYLPESPTSCKLSITDWERLYKPFYPRFNRELFYDLIHRFKLSSKELISSLSHGNKKKFWLAYALSTGAKWILLDEPTNGLDIQSKSVLKVILSEVNHSKQSIVIATHHILDIGNLMDELMVIENRDLIVKADISHIQKQLFFKYGLMADEDRIHALHTELIPGTQVSIFENKLREDSEIHFEVLIKAISENSLIKQLISQGL